MQLISYNFGGAEIETSAVKYTTTGNLFEELGFDKLDEKADSLPIDLERQDNADPKTVMPDSFGFGGTNATLIFTKQHNRNLLHSNN